MFLHHRLNERSGLGVVGITGRLQRQAGDEQGAGEGSDD
jgi:hypothetical protein